MAYPPVNGQSDPVLGGTFCKKEWLQEAQEVNILWNVYNSDECIKSTEVFRPNHFCAMIRPSDLDEPVIIENIADEQVVNEPENITDEPIVNESENAEVTAKAKPIYEFRAVKDIFELMRDATNSEGTEFIKKGNKTGKTFFIKHENTQRFLKGQNFDYPPDDKSSYHSKGCPPRTFIYQLIDGELIQETNIKYEHKKFIDCKTKAEIPADEMKEKVVVKYTTHKNKSQPNLLRRSTYVVMAPENQNLNLNHLLNTSFIEYCGLDTDIGSSKAVHGNSRNLNKPYHR